MSTFGHSLRTLENALDCARDERRALRLLLVEHGLRQLPRAGGDRGPPARADRHLRRAQARRREDRDRLQAGLRPDYTIIRPSALYGPGCVSRRVSQIFIESALVGDTLRVDGDGDERLDFSYIDDVVDGVSARSRHPERATRSSTSRPATSRSLAELIALVQEHFPEVEVEYVERDALRPYRGTLSIDKARRLIGYEPRTTLEDGLDRYVAWYRELVADGVLAARSLRTAGCRAVRARRSTRCSTRRPSRPDDLRAAAGRTRRRCRRAAGPGGARSRTRGCAWSTSSVTLGREPGLDRHRAGAVRRRRPEHATARCSPIAERSFRRTRFHLDPASPTPSPTGSSATGSRATCSARAARSCSWRRPAGELGRLPRRARGAGTTRVIDLDRRRPGAPRTRASGAPSSRAACATRRACERVQVGTQVANLGAIRFYERLGFVRRRDRLRPAHARRVRIGDADTRERVLGRRRDRQQPRGRPGRGPRAGRARRPTPARTPSSCRCSSPARFVRRRDEARFRQLDALPARARRGGAAGGARARARRAVRRDAVRPRQRRASSSRSWTPSRSPPATTTSGRCSTRSRDTGEPVIVSTGMLDLEGTVALGGPPCRRGAAESALLHCVSAYPAAAERAQPGGDPAAWRSGSAARSATRTTRSGSRRRSRRPALGARILEKHVTLGHDFSDFRDHQLSAEPRRAARARRAGRRSGAARRRRRVGAARCSGTPRSASSPPRRPTQSRRGARSRRPRPAARAPVRAEDLIWMRPRDGLAPGEEHLLVGRTLTRDVPEGESILAADVS